MSARAIIGIRYVDAPAGIAWLCEAFGFEKKLVVPGPDGTVAHSQLVFDTGMVMVGSALGEGYGQYVRAPEQLEGATTHGAYLVVPDADAVYARAKAAGAEVLMDIVDQDYGGRGFTCRDPQGHVWSVGTYDPWA